VQGAGALYHVDLVLSAPKPEDLMSCMSFLETLLCRERWDCAGPSGRGWIVASLDGETGECLVKVKPFQPDSVYRLGVVSPYSVSIGIVCSASSAAVDVVTQFVDAVKKCGNAAALVLNG